MPLTISPGYNQSYISAKMNQAAKKLGLSKEQPVGHKNIDKNAATKNDHGAITKTRLPPGQFLTQQFPILDLGVRPELAFEKFSLKIHGEVENPLTLDHAAFTALPTIEIVKDFHCVTRWSRYDLRWRGVPFEAIIKLAKPKATVQHVIFESRDGYTTNVRFAECLNIDVIVAYELEEGPIPLMHGGPVRMIVPLLYGWKSAKFLNGIKFATYDEPGFWEVRGYNNHGDPWKEERYS